MPSAQKQSPLKPSQQLRLDLLDLVQAAGQSHLGGPLSCLDILISLYSETTFNFKKDHFVLSAGHLAPAYYVVLAHAGFFKKTCLKTYSRFGSTLQGHVSTDVPGVEYSSGSLGQGLSFATGLALGHPHHHTVCLTTDGEHQQGQIWEALMFANKYKLKNLINIIDYNRHQVDGPVQKIMPLGNLKNKYQSFGWQVLSINGHNFSALDKAFRKAKKSLRPTAIIAKTIFAKGIPSIENDFHYHDVKNLPDTFFDRARHQIQS